MIMKNALNWFEIPAADYDRAVNFYSTVLDTQLYPMEMEGMKIAAFPADQEGVKGAVVKSDFGKPSADGTTVYLNAGNDLTEALGRVEENGGKVLMPKTAIGPNMGNFALFIDSEGNKVAFFSPN